MSLFDLYNSINRCVKFQINIPHNLDEENFQK